LRAECELITSIYRQKYVLILMRYTLRCIVTAYAIKGTSSRALVWVRLPKSYNLACEVLHGSLKSQRSQLASCSSLNRIASHLEWLEKGRTLIGTDSPIYMHVYWITSCDPIETYYGIIEICYETIATKIISAK
jgi:hypothetical protein